MLALQHVQTRFQDLLFLDVGAVHRLSSRSAGPSASGRASAVSGRTRLAIGSGQFADIRYLFLDMRRAAGLFDGGVQVGLLAQAEHRRMLCRDVADVPVCPLADFGDRFLGSADQLDDLRVLELWMVFDQPGDYEVVDAESQSYCSIL